MPGESMMREKVMSYLTGLSPAARAMLLRRLEIADGEARLDGEMRLILEAARSMAAGQAPARPTPPSRPAAPPDPKASFFAPFAPFVIDESLPEHQRGWIRRSSLDGIWDHLAKGVLASPLVPWSKLALALDDFAAEEFEAAIAEMRETGFAELQRAARGVADDPKEAQRLAIRLGGPESLVDLRDMLALRPRLPVLAKLFARLPGTIWPGDATEKGLCDLVAAHLDRQPEDDVWVAAGMVGRLASPVVYFRAAVAAARATDVVDIRNSPGEVFVDFGLSAAARAIAAFDDLRDRRGGAAALVAEIRRFHEVERAANTTIRVDDDSRWRHRLAALRRSMSESIADEIEEILPTLQRALRVDAGSAPSAADGEDAVRAVALFVAARRYRESLAINEMVTRLNGLVQQAVDVYGREIVEKLRKARGAQRESLLAASDHLVRIAEYTHGEEYAGLLRKSRDMAAHRATG